MMNSHYNLVDTLIHLDKDNFNLALNCIIKFQFKADMKIERGLLYSMTDVIIISAMIKEEWEESPLPVRMHGPYASTLADAALWAYSQKYRHEPS